MPESAVRFFRFVITPGALLSTKAEIEMHGELGLAPVVRAGGDANHLRAFLGRVVAEAAFWTPAALLPQAGVVWEAVDADTARAAVHYAGRYFMSPRTAARCPLLSRWSNANPTGEYRIQPFSGMLSDFREVSGYRLPFRVDGGNFFGTEGYTSPSSARR